MQIGMLGPFEVHDDSGAQLEVAGARLRALLILLALDTGRVVGAQRLIDAIWADEPPSGEANALQALVSRACGGRYAASRLSRTRPGTASLSTQP